MRLARPGEEDLIIAGDFHLQSAELPHEIHATDRTRRDGSVLNRLGNRTPALLDHIIRDYRSSRKAGLQFKINAKNATLLRSPALPSLYVETAVALAARPSPGVASAQAKAGECAEARFNGNTAKPYCKMKLLGMALNRVICKGR